MAISSLSSQPQRPQKKDLTQYIYYALALVGVVLLIYFAGDIFNTIMGLAGKSELTVKSVHGDAQVYLNGELIGNTPLEKYEVRAGENKVTVTGEKNGYEVSLNFEPNTEIVLERDLGVSEVFSSGQNLWFESSNGGVVFSVISEPSGASVFIDNTEVGQTPYSSESLTEGEYDLRIEYPGFEPQVTRISISPESKLNVVSKLFPMPVPSKISLLEGSTSLYDVYTSQQLVSASPASWVDAVVYWNETRGIGLSGAGVNKDMVFDYFVDFNGGIYDSTGELLIAVPTDVTRGAYLRRESDGPGITEEAKAVLLATSPELGGPTATILETGVGWLRVRDAAGLGGEEVTKVDVGNTYPVLEQTTGWVKIKVDDSTEGWVSSTYVEVSETEDSADAEAALGDEDDAADETPEDTTEDQDPAE